MQIQVCGFDPSLTHWGIAKATLDLDTAELSTPYLCVINPEDLKGKQVRNNSKDLYRAEQLAKAAFEYAQESSVVFVEVPHGSQSARAMTSYGVCIGILAALRAKGVSIIEVTATENKQVFTGDKNATKDQMINQAVLYYPDANWPRHQRDGKAGKTAWKSGDLKNVAEHMADAIAAIHAGCATKEFEALLQILNSTRRNK